MTATTEVLCADPPERFRWSLDAVLDLLLRPDRFFLRLRDSGYSSFPFLGIWLLGICLAVNTLDRQMWMREAMGTTGDPAPFEDSWSFIWTIIVITGLLRGPMAWLIAGWWYRVRLRFSGTHDPHPRLARYVYLYSNLVAAVPLLLVLVLDTLFFPSYTSASAAGTLYWAVLSAVLWSIYVSYRGAIACFDTRRALARIWFLILPLVIYGGAAAFFAALPFIETS